MSKEIAAFGSNAMFALVALVNGAVGVEVAPSGRLLLAIAVTIDGEKITWYELIADPPGFSSSTWPYSTSDRS